MDSSNPFDKPTRLPGTRDKSDLYWSTGIHAGILLILIVMSLIGSSTDSIPMGGGGDFVSVEMIVLDSGNVPSEDVQEEVQEEAVEVAEVVEVSEVVEDLTEPLEEVAVDVTDPTEETSAEIDEPAEEASEESVPEAGTEFIGVGSQGEAGGGAPGPASYEGRVFSAIRRNFRTALNPVQSYRISFTVNLDGSHSYEVLRTSGDNGFDRAVAHALNSASIPPVPPGRTSSVTLQIEFFGPE
jgi:outer membrane biosynthesis protein TonB